MQAIAPPEFAARTSIVSPGNIENMNFKTAIALALLSLAAGTAQAQESGHSGVQQQPLPDVSGDTPVEAQPLPDISGQAPAEQQPMPQAVEPALEKIANGVAEFSGLDKITGRTITFDVYIDETVQFGTLQVTPRVCYSRPATETPKTDAFVEVDEITLDRNIRRIFTGWMFADSPGLNAIEHPIYDVWLKDCKMESEVAPPQ